MKKTFYTASSLLLTAAAAFAGQYKVSVPLPSDFEGAMAYIVNFDTSENVDSVLVEDGVAEFTGTVAEPFTARLIVDGNRMSTFILEDGDIVVSPVERKVTGGKLNTQYAGIQAVIGGLEEDFRNAQTDAQREAIYSRYNEYADSVMMANLDNAIGYTILLDKAYEFEPAELEAFVEQNPGLKKYTRINKLIDFNKRKLATSEGSKFVDFEIEYDGVKHKLSDVVGKGDYVLVDFWASWCGPCIRQTAVLKDIYKEYADKGLKILGVAVWDEPENTKKAIVQHELPWESWLNGQSVPTDAYGISGIPCIILFGPDGTILSRDKQSDELKAAVAAAMANR